MNTTFGIAALLTMSMFACAAPAEEEVDGDAPGVETSSTQQRMINQGSCTPAQLAMGAWEAGGVCFSGGGAGGGGGGSGACAAKCSSNSGKCEARCEARGSTTACLESCFRLESLCLESCH